MTSSEESTFDRRRRLCPDGACVGLIGDNNLCKVCGQPADGNPDALAVAPEAVTTWDGSLSESDDSALPGTLEDVAQLGEAEEAGGFDPKRKLCSDDSCVGVVGADGRCGVCGRPGE
jgi:hypothetical protein